MHSILKDKKIILYHYSLNELWTVYNENDILKIYMFFINLKNNTYIKHKESDYLFYFRCPENFLKITPIISPSWRKDVVERISLEARN